MWFPGRRGCPCRAMEPLPGEWCPHAGTLPHTASPGSRHSWQPWGKPGTHLLADEGARRDVLQGPHAPAHILCPVELQPCPGKQVSRSRSSAALNSHPVTTPRWQDGGFLSERLCPHPSPEQWNIDPPMSQEAGGPQKSAWLSPSGLSLLTYKPGQDTGSQPTPKAKAPACTRLRGRSAWASGWPWDRATLPGALPGPKSHASSLFTCASRGPCGTDMSALTSELSTTRGQRRVGWSQAPLDYRHPETPQYYHNSCSAERTRSIDLPLQPEGL